MDKMKFDNQTKIWIALGILVLAIFLFKAGFFTGKFQIADSDLSPVVEYNYVVNASDSPILAFEQPNLIVLNNSGQITKLINGKEYYILDANVSRPSTFLVSIPTDIPQGQHTLTKVQYYAYDQYTKVNLQTRSKDFFQSIKIEGPIQYVDRNITQIEYKYNGTEYINQTVYVNQTVEKKIYLEPDVNMWIVKYQYYILGIALLGLWYYYNRRKK